MAPGRSSPTRLRTGRCGPRIRTAGAACYRRHMERHLQPHTASSDRRAVLSLTSIERLLVGWSMPANVLSPISIGEKDREMAHWVYILSAISGPLGLAVWRYAPRAFLLIVGGLTKDLQRSKQCAEMLRLLRKDAKDLPSYLVTSPESSAPPPVAVPPPLEDGNPVTVAMEATPRPHARAS